MTAYNMLGEGFVVTCEDDSATEKIRKFNRKINSNYQTIDNWVIDNWIDCMNHQVGSVWVVKRRVGSPEEPELWRVPPETLTIAVDYRNGWMKYVQMPDYNRYYRTYDQFMLGKIGSEITSKERILPVGIPIDPEVMTNVRLFKRAPMSSATKFIVFKHIVMFFMRKYGEKMWAPLVLAMIGMPGTDQYPHTDDEMDAAMDQTLNMLKKSKNFGYGALAGNTTIKTVDPKVDGGLYLKYVAAMDEQILYSLYASMSLKSGTGVYRGTDEERENRKNFLLGIRKEFTNELKKLWCNVIVPGYDPEKVNVQWPPIRSSTITDIASAFDTFSKGGVFIDAQERRDVAATIWPFLRGRNLTEKEKKKMDDTWITMVSPSQPGETTVSASKGGKTGSNSKSTNKSS